LRLHQYLQIVIQSIIVIVQRGVFVATEISI